MNNNYVVYVHINKTNFKTYVGQTCQLPERRWRNGKGYLYGQKNTFFASAIKKYGWDNFEHIILEEHLTKNQADFYENMYIKIYQSTNNSYGYNLTSGGSSTILTDEVRQKMRDHHADFTKTNNPMYGKNIKNYMTEEAYNNWLNSHCEYGKQHRGGNSLSAKKVYCVEKQKEYGSLVEASDECNVSVPSISNCLHGKRLSTVDKETGARYHWCFADDKDNFIPPSSEESLLIGKFNPNIRKIFCPEFNEIFYGTGDIARKYNICSSHIIDVCNGKRKSCGIHPHTHEKLHWYFIE